MADANTALPVRSEADGTDARLQAKLVDFTTPANGATIDSSGALSTNEAKIAGTVVSVNNGIAGAGTQRVTLASDSTGQVTLAAGANTIGSLAANQSVNVAQIAGTTTSVNTGNANAGTQRVVIASDQPAIAVTLGTPTGDDVMSYDTQAALAGGASDTHTYTVTAAKTLILGRIFASASGKMKIEVQVDLGAGLVTKWVMFNSTANPNMEIDLQGLGFNIAATLQVTVIRTNRENQAIDVYSTITGTEV